MTTAIQIMLLAVMITFATGFLISFLIQMLCRIVSIKRQSTPDEASKIALAVALAIGERRGK